MEREINVDVKVEQLEAMNGLLKDSVRQQGDTIRGMRHIIIALVVSFAVTVIAGFATFAWYESRFEYEEQSTTEVYSEGDNSNAEYINGSQYNDSATHNEEVGDE